MKKILALLLMASGFMACQNGNHKSEPTDTALADTLSYAYDSVKVYSQHVLKDTTQASISYPVFKNDALNTYIKRHVFDYFAKEEPVTSYQDIANSFVKGYDDFVNNNKDTHQTWFLNIKIKVLKQTAHYLALQVIHSDYAGGAHGNTNISYINYNPQTNEEITLDSLIQKDKMPQLLSIAESIFRKDEKLATTESLADKYFFENDKFALANSFYIDDKGLLFLYNPYEIKPYASGITRLSIPFSALKDIAKPNSILTTNL